MDELAMVREVLSSSPPPSPQVTAQARRRLAERIDGHHVRVSRLAGPRSRRTRWTVAFAGAAAACLAGALAVTLIPGNTKIPGNVNRGSVGAEPGPASSRQGPAGRGEGGLVTSERPLGTLTGQPAGTFLTALAVRVAQLTPATGRYWCLTSTTGQLAPIGPGGQELTPAGQGETPSPVSDYRYSIFARQNQVDCFQYSRAGSSNVGGYFQDLGAKPATAADTAAWRRDGSPAWHAWAGKGQLIPSRPGPAHRLGGKSGQEPWGDGASLPADPAKLRAALLAGVPRSDDPMVRTTERLSRKSYAQIRDEYLFQQARVLLLDPLAPAVRAAAYQVLASIPGVHMKSGVTDAAGRGGTALWMGPSSDPGEITIVDPATGMLLADEWLTTQPQGVYAPNTLTQYTLWRTPGWSDQFPAAGR
jgi:hypothetical protein